MAILFTDIRLGGVVTGWDVADAYLLENPAIKIVYCSGNSLDELRRVPGSTFVPKPYRMESILRVAGEC